MPERLLRRPLAATCYYLLAGGVMLLEVIMTSDCVGEKVNVSKQRGQMGFFSKGLHSETRSPIFFVFKNLKRFTHTATNNNRAVN